MLTSPKWVDVGASVALNESPRLPDISIRESKPNHEIRHQVHSLSMTKLESKTQSIICLQLKKKK